jgi:membrane protease YdiL (CAAX protease family)
VNEPAIPRLRLGLLLWTAGMLGVIAITFLLLPRLLAELPRTLGREAPHVPLWLLLAASLAQSGVLLALVVWIGVALGRAVRLHAPAFEAAVTGTSVVRALQPQVLPGIAGGVLGGILLVMFVRLAPPELASAQLRLDLPLVARVLYGGLTEEILLRWGVMTLLVWAAWRFLQRRTGEPAAGCVWIAILLSAVVFGLGHLPAARLLIGGLTPTVIVFVIAANALFGIVAGRLYWRYGLESAMLAHALAHVLNYVVGPR